MAMKIPLERVGTPDLPVPDRDMHDPEWQAQYADDWGTTEAPSIWNATTSYEVGVFPGTPDITVWYDGEPLEPFTIDEARAVAYAILAAAQYTKEDE